MKIFSFTISAVFILAGCQPAEEPAPKGTGKPKVAAVNYPLAYFAERIGGGLVEVHFPKIEGDPAFWQPTAADLRPFQEADLILLNGASYAKWRSTASLPASRCVDTSAAFREAFIKVKASQTHQHGKAGKHSHAGTAFTTWLDLKLAEQHAATIRDTLVRRLPGSKAVLEKNFATLRTDLRQLDAALGNAANRIKTPVCGSHPVYQYLASRYGLKIPSVHWEPEVMPDAKGWAELAKLRESHPATLMLWEDTPAPAIAAKLKEQGVACVVFNPCGNRPESGDWLAMMQVNVAALATVAPKE